MKACPSSVFGRSLRVPLCRWHCRQSLFWLLSPRSDPKFATRVEAALQANAPADPPASRKASAARKAPAAPAPPPPPPRPKHKPALLDPFAVYENGWEVMLNQRLDRLTASQLGDVIHQYKLDPQDRMSDEKNAERLREWIVKAVLKKAGKL